MRYKIRKTSRLPEFGFKLEEIYEGDEDNGILPLMGYTCIVANWGLEKFWIEVPIDEYERGKVIDAVPFVYLLRSTGFALEDGDWEYFLPKLVELWNAGILEVVNE